MTKHTKKHDETEVEVTPIDMQDVIDAEPRVHDHIPPVVSDVPAVNDIEAEAVRLEQNGQPGAAAKLRAKAAGQPEPDAQQKYLQAISLRK